jgi:hypothetical protein
MSGAGPLTPHSAPTRENNEYALLELAAMTGYAISISRRIRSCVEAAAWQFIEKPAIL